MMIYAAGNFIAAAEDTPYLQIGENKYGKPILDRTVRFDLPVEEAVKIAALVVRCDHPLEYRRGPADRLLHQAEGPAAAGRAAPHRCRRPLLHRAARRLRRGDPRGARLLPLPDWIEH
jgi:hypothetical protein